MALPFGLLETVLQAQDKKAAQEDRENPEVEEMRRLGWRLEEDTVIDFESCAKLRCDLAPQDPLPNLPRYRTKDEAPFEMGAGVQSSLRYNRLAHLVVPR